MNPIRVCKNKKSGKYFIHIADLGTDKFTLVTPQGKVKILEKRLFEEPTTGDEGTITELQHKVYQKYREGGMEDLRNFLERTIAEMSPYELAEFKKTWKVK